MHSLRRLLEPCILKPRLVRHAKMCVPQHVNVPFTHKVNKKAIFRSPGISLVLSRPVWNGYFIQHCRCVFQLIISFAEWRLSQWLMCELCSMLLVIMAVIYSSECSTAISYTLHFTRCLRVKAFQLISHCLCNKHISFCCRNVLFGQLFKI